MSCTALIINYASDIKTSSYIYSTVARRHNSKLIPTDFPSISYQNIPTTSPLHAFSDGLMCHSIEAVLQQQPVAANNSPGTNEI